ncbi:substrate-binding domain-containing protein [Microbulbifer sp. MLAF003]|uniref:substrate-binding domain-containing protein n=1 Tax=Microbulbifer sp. MLAF003 TaxID=3032582 RepID=UPI0024AC9A16|nr:substrate-binding domain-containing protein [Microbulbifer sp. MLAF003]WHI51207.1 substrate-binding domain-containing protein [Microbulbifer sp. MLAF003]
MSSADGEHAVGSVAQGTVDFAFVNARENYPDALDFSTLGRQPVLCLASPDHALAQESSASLSEAAQYRQIITASVTSQHRWQLSAQIWICDSLLQALDLACKGVGWVNAPYELARPFLKSGKLVELNLTSALSAWSLDVDLLWSARTAQGQAGLWFAREARRLYGNYYSPPIEITDRS